MPGTESSTRPVVGVMTVDDQAHFRQAAREVIDGTDGFELLGEAGSGEEALALAREVRPDLVLLDVRMPGLDGFETARRLRAAHPAAVVVLISTDDVTGPMCDSCGASAFLQKKEFGQGALRGLWAAHGR